jgi:hypothetical protein
MWGPARKRRPFERTQGKPHCKRRQNGGIKPPLQRQTEEPTRDGERRKVQVEVLRFAQVYKPEICGGERTDPKVGHYKNPLQKTSKGEGLG